MHLSCVKLCAIFVVTEVVLFKENDSNEGFPRTRITKRSCACDCGRGPVSVGAFFLLLSSFFPFFFFFPHPESCSKIKISAGKSDVLGEGLGGPRSGREEMKTNEK